MRDKKFRNFSLARDPFGVADLMSVPEMKALLGLIINMGLMSSPDIKDYWSSEWITQIKFLVM
jgi:hypothetical protein